MHLKSILSLRRFLYERFCEVATHSKLLLASLISRWIFLSLVSVEELECLATWKEGSSRYLVGRLHHGHASSNEDRYRCFVYEKAGQTVQSNLNRTPMGMGAMDHEVALPGGPVPEGSAEVYRVAQSGDATCNGLFSPMEGSRTMTLRKGESDNVSMCFNSVTMKFLFIHISLQRDCWAIYVAFILSNWRYFNF